MKMIVDLVSAVQQSDWERARQLLYQHWVNECPKLYAANSEHPWETSHDETAINNSLFTPLAGAFCADSSVREPTLKPLNEQAGITPETRRPGQICGHVFKSGELTYRCRDCAVDSTCVICHACFQQSEHKNHKYKMHTSSGSSYCDCGDPDAWTSGYACKLHAKDDSSANVVPYCLPPQLEARVRNLSAVVLQYSTNLICWPNKDALPRHLKVISENGRKEVSTVAPYMTVLYNDETHTYENVIRALELFIHCSKDQAMLIATIVDREGRSSVKVGSKQDCERTKSDIQRRTQRSEVNRRTDKNGPLDVKVMESEVVAHQNHAIALMTWINNQMEQFPVLGEVIGDILLTCYADDELTDEEDMEVEDREKVKETLLVRLLRWDKKMWKAARANTHQILMKTVLMNFEQKLKFSKKFLEHYEEIYSEFIDDDHDVDVSVVSLTVQFLTVSSIARRLIAEDNAMGKMFDALMTHTDKYVKEPNDPVSRFDFTTRSFPVVVKRAMHMMRDVVYILTSIPQPADWSDQLREKFLRGCKAFISFLHRMQGMDEVKRQSVEHQVWELEWETAFNIQLRMQEILSLVTAWAATDKTVHHSLLKMCLDALAMHPPTSSDENNGETHCIVDVNGDRAVVSAFDVLRGAVSIHQPLWRLTGGLFSVKGDFLQFLMKGNDSIRLDDMEKTILDQIKTMGSALYEQSLRVLVLCAQASAQLWRRNGFSLVNQIHNYYSPLCRTEMFDRDLLMMQVGAALSPPTEFILHLMCRYRVTQWAELSFDGSARQGTPFGKMEPEETSKIIVILAEEMLHILILIIGERFRLGVGKCSPAKHINREVLHILCTGPQPFSHIQKRISHDPMLEKLSLHDAVNTVAEFRKPTSTSAGQFHLKESLLHHYNPFFYHYSKSDLSQAEQYQQKIRTKAERKIIACPPPVPCEFEPFFAPIRYLLKTPSMIKITRAVLERTSRRNRFSSDRLLHRALYLIGMALNEQATDPRCFDYTTLADKEDIFNLMETLAGSSEVSTHSDLLWWTIQKYKEVERISKSGNSVEKEGETEIRGENIDEARNKRATIAAKMRAQAMQKMSKMQKSFMQQLEMGESTEEQTIEEGKKTQSLRVDDDEDFVSKVSDHGFPVCLGPNRSRVEVTIPRKVTCILCQEEELLVPNQFGRPFVCAAYVQKSHLFTQKNVPDFGNKVRDLASVNLQIGIDASTCSHTMHYECYMNLSDTLLNRERQRPRQQLVINQKMVDPEVGEFLCPLCKRLSNTAMPLLPALQLMNIEGFSSVCGGSEEFKDWIERVSDLLEAPALNQQTQKPVKTHSRKRSHSERSLLDLAKQGDDLSSMPLDNTLSTSVPSASTMSLLMGGNHTPKRTLSQTNPKSDSSIDADDVDGQRAVEFFENLAAMLGGRDTETKNEVTSPSASVSHDDASRRDRRTESTLRNFSFPHVISGFVKGIPFPGIAALLKVFKKIVGPSYERYEEMVRGFSKILIKSRGRPCEDTKSKELLEEHLRAYLAAIATWQSSAHVARATAAILAYERKPLFGALNTRQRDCLLAMSRLSAVLSFCMQHLPHVIAGMLRVLLSPPPTTVAHSNSPHSPEYVTSPEHNLVHNSPIGISSTEQTTNITGATKLLSSPIAQFFCSSHHKKEANVNLLHVDMLSLAISLMMSVGWTWQDGIQSMKQPPRHVRELLPDGSLDELHVLRLCMLGLYFQVFATFMDSEMSSESSINSLLKSRLCFLWNLARPDDTPLVDIVRLQTNLENATLSLLRPLALFYHGITQISPPEALKDPSLNEFEPLCRYMGLPSTLFDLLQGTPPEQLFKMWSTAIPTDPFNRHSLVPQPVQPNLLVDLPHEYSDVINMAATFRCPSIPLDENASNVPTMCLVCGQILCSQSYCCQKLVNKETTGACRYHMMSCSGSMGAFLRIRDCSIILMTNRNRGCFRPAPYVDEFGEADQGFRRGNPLHLNSELYQKLRQLWLHQGITEEVVNQYEIDHRNIQYEWAHF